MIIIMNMIMMMMPVISTLHPLEFHERSRLGSSDMVAWDEVGAMRAARRYPETFLPGARCADAGGRLNPVIAPMVCLLLY